MSAGRRQVELQAGDHAAGAAAVSVPGGVDANRPDRGGARRREVERRVAAKGASRRARSRLLASCDRCTAIGRRDFAIILVLSRLGLRACEVARLELGDVDWRAGELAVRGKRDRHERVPLPADVGDALVDYLRHGRPDRKDQHLFLTARPPIGPLNGDTIGMLVRSAARRAGLEPHGAHRLRHTVATEVLRAGAPLEEVASLLRHRRHATSVIYAKVDWERLRQLARPWPQSAS